MGISTTFFGSSWDILITVEACSTKNYCSSARLFVLGWGTKGRRCTVFEILLMLSWAMIHGFVLVFCVVFGCFDIR